MKSFRGIFEQLDLPENDEVMAKILKMATAKGGEEEREEEKEGFTLSEEERAYYVSALHASKEIVKGARLPVSDILVGEVFRKTTQNLFWVRTEGVQEKRRAKVQEKKAERCKDGDHCARSPEPKPEPKGIGQRWKVRRG